MQLPKPTLYTDFYELTMAQGYYLSGRYKHAANFDYFFRKLPFEGGYVCFAGLADFLEMLRQFEFDRDELDYLSSQGFKDDFLQYLDDFSFSGTLYSMKEGEVVFPNEPVVRVEGNVLEVQVLETALLNILNFESLIATKTSRIKQSASERKVLDFGLRRSHGTGGMQASKAAIIGGADGSSNVLAGKEYGIPVSGTMAHSWVQSFESELESFRTFAEHYPENCVLLVDTYDTLASGIPNAITAGQELEDKGYRLKAVRLDSGDLAYLARKTREMLDSAGLDYVKIVASNQLDEYVIKSLLDQEAPIDMFGVGTRLVTAYDDPALDGVYKLSSYQGNPTLKISENIEKITIPGRKKVLRYLDDEGYFRADGLLMHDEEDVDTIYHPHFPSKHLNISECKKEELLHPVVQNGEINVDIPSARESAEYARERLGKLKPEHKRFNNPHIYKVGISKKLQQLKDELIKESKSKL